MVGGYVIPPSGRKGLPEGPLAAQVLEVLNAVAVHTPIT